MCQNEKYNTHDKAYLAHIKAEKYSTLLNFMYFKNLDHL